MTEQIIKSLEGKELESIRIDSVENSIEFIISENENSVETIGFEGILEFNYLPDFSDKGPLLILDCEYESGLLKNMIRKINLLWAKEAPAVEGYLDVEVHRLKILSGDVELIIAFKKIKTGTQKT